MSNEDNVDVGLSQIFVLWVGGSVPFSGGEFLEINFGVFFSDLFFFLLFLLKNLFRLNWKCLFH